MRALHGTRTRYQQGCHCPDCTRANTHRLPVRREQAERAGRLCLICGIALIDHPMKACWREIR